MRPTRVAACLTAALLFAMAVNARADVKCASVFGDHMVLQRDAKVPVWGTADAGEDVTVKVGGQTKSAKAGDGGKWRVDLDPLPVGGPVVVEVAGGKNQVKFDDVLVGDVWVCSGQSNMSFQLNRADHAEEEIKKADHPKIRLFDVKRATSAKPLDAVSGKWAACTPESAKTFTAVGYFFGRHLNEKLDVPIGLIHSSWGGTPAEAWTDEPTLKADPDYAAALARGASYASEYPKLMERYEAAVKKQKEDDAKAKAQAAEPKPEGGAKPSNGKPTTAKAAAAPRRPAQPLRKPEAPGQNPHLPAVLYNAMIAPLQPYAIKGAIWYQGEANSSRAAQYRKLLPAMITDWRRAWGQGDFPFLIVQLANYGKDDAKKDGSAWAELREAQALTAAKLPNCGLAVTIDIGNPENIHPTNKQDVGKRLGLAAERLVYGRDVEHAGPTYQSMSVEGDKARLKFDHLAGGLEAHGSNLAGFTIAGEDKKFVPAEATIEPSISSGGAGDTVVVSAPGVSKPAAVRYGWAASPTCTLYNKAGLPAVPFRTDDWPMVTAAVR